MQESIIITGAGTGIGLATALVLADEGYRVFATVPAPDQEAPLREAAAQYGVDVDVLHLDVTDRDSIQSAVDQVVAASGSVYGVVNSAGLGLRGFFEDIRDEEVRRLYEVNVFGAMAVTRAVLPCMRAARRGRIVFIGSAAGRVATMTVTAYGAGKFALEGFAEALALELDPFQVYVSVVDPGLVLTPRFAQNRVRARGSMDPHSPYHAWFLQCESMTDQLLRQSQTRPAQVARAVHRALSARRPRLRYVVGRGARIVIGLRRHLPDRLFEWLYYRQIVRRVTRPRTPATRFNDLELPGDNPIDYLGLPPPRSGSRT